MKFHQAAGFLFDLRRFSPRQGIDPTAELLSYLDDPHEDLACIQIAGSNGKGSTARMVESTLREAGLDVGLYTSPHFDDVRERIQINGRKIPESAVVDFVETVKPFITDRAADGEGLTFFETITTLALWEFDRRNVDVAVLEVGMGGRYDATSVVDPIASAVTAVTLEHTDVLGDDVGTIARDKAQVAPADGPLVTATDGDALAAIRDEIGETILVSEDGESSDVSVSYDGRVGVEGDVSIQGDGWHVETRLPLLGAHQARNAGVACALVQQIAEKTDRSIGVETMIRGLRNAHWPGRFEIMSRNPLIVLDGAHNPGSCAVLADTLSDFEFERLHLVIGIMADKDHRGIAAELDVADTVLACEAATDRATDNEALARAFEQETNATVRTRGDVTDALGEAIETADEGDCVLVAGSLSTVGEARRRWSRTGVPKRAQSVEVADRVLRGANVAEADVLELRTGAVNRIVKTHVQPRKAHALREGMLSVGGECAISGLDRQDENRAVVLMGTLSQFERLCRHLDETGDGLVTISEEIRSALDIGSDRPEYPWERDTAIMGILNVTPDSFHDGGEYDTRQAAVERATEMIEAGVDIVDVGGESTRPGADPVPVDEERSRVVPVVEALDDLDVLVSVDTRKSEVARAALDAGADILNDVSGLEDPDMRLIASEYDVPVVVMHSIDTPVVPERDVPYDDVVEDVIEELTERVLLAEKAGLDRSQIIVDPGLGFGKSSAESFELLGRIDEFQGLGCPVLVGHSHKSMFEHVDRSVDERYEPTIAATTLAAERGADIVRVHDVGANVAAVDVVEAARKGAYGTD